MKEATKTLLAKIENAHDWQEGQFASGGGTELHQTDTCRVCGLRRHWYIDPQDGVPATYRFSDAETGNDLTMRQAAARTCLE